MHRPVLFWIAAVLGARPLTVPLPAAAFTTTAGPIVAPAARTVPRPWVPYKGLGKKRVSSSPSRRVRCRLLVSPENGRPCFVDCLVTDSGLLVKFGFGPRRSVP